jgi:signal transduction histidine kinase
LQQNCFDAALLDLTLPDSQGLASLEPIIRLAPSLPIVVLTNTNDEQLAIEAVRQGAQDYLVKRQVNVEGLIRSLQYAIERKRVAEALREEKEVLESQIKERTAELVEAQKINQLKSEFVSMFSHDFRNPLTVILASAGLLEEKRYKLTPEKKLILLEKIVSAGKNMNQLLDEVLWIGKSDSGQLNYHPTYLHLESFCQQLLEDLEMSLGHKHHLLLTSQGDFSQTIWDENLLRHILGNLLANAIKYSPPGSTLKLELIAEETTATLRIQDNGIGIPAEDLPNLFQPFHRGSNVRQVSGTGLGLAIVKRCVEIQGGQISVESEEGIGSTFTVTLPLVKIN